MVGGGYRGDEQHAMVNSQRGQSEPLAALVAVTVVCLVISTSIGLFEEIRPQIGSDRSVTAPTADAVSTDLTRDGRYDAETPIEELVSPHSLPDGKYVAIRITIIDQQGETAVVDSAQFTPDGQRTDVDTPGETATLGRPVAVSRAPGDVQPGRLVVEVWDG